MNLTLDHVVLEVADAEAAAAFYEALLGIAPVRLAEFRRGEAPFVSGRVTAETVLDYFPPALWQHPERPTNMHHLCFTASAPEVAALRERLAARGIAIERERPRNFGAQGWGVSLYFTDPDGISVEVRHYPAAD